MNKSSFMRGYTLIELIVSVAIFSIVMLVASAAFLTLINLDRQARATNDVVTNLSYVVDSMERAIRTGTAYSTTSGGSSFSFTDADGRLIRYRLTGGQVEQQIDSSGGWTALTDPRINVQTLAFYTRGTTPSDALQPMVVFTMRGTVKPSAQSEDVEFVIESGATQRLIDI